ncbi:MAG TPA: hypothetical protein VGJ75_03635, partial [Dongiaceae bacterium]
MIGRAALEMAPDVEGQQLPEAAVARRPALATLQDVEVRQAIALHQDRPLLQDRDIPADDDAVVQLRMR